MKKNSKLALLLATSTLVAVVATGSVIINNKINVNTSGAVTWNHYSAVNPDFETRGSKEYWVNCSTHEHTLQEPVGGMVVDKGAPSASEINSWETTDNRLILQYKIDDSHVWYGYYPQTKVSDETLLANLKYVTTKNSAGYYEYKGECYAKLSATPYGGSGNFEDGSTISDGSTYWFKVEPIVWDILSDLNGCYLLNCSNLLINHRYANSSNNYMTSELREYMNGEFYSKAFYEDNSKISLSAIDNSPSTTNGVPNSYTCDQTEDYIFSLSYQDYLDTSYGYSVSKENSSTRCCKTTDYARASGAYYELKSEYLYNGYYWTRSPDSVSSDFVSSGSPRGGVSYARSVEGTSDCIRPAMNLVYKD